MTVVPILAAWLDLEPTPALVGSRCAQCSTVAFPPSVGPCPNPYCGADQMQRHRLEQRGRVWSYTDARYQPPPPYVPVTDPYVPFMIAAVELEADGLVVLGQIAAGFGIGDLATGDEVELITERHGERDGAEVRVWKWRPTKIEGQSNE